MDTDKRIYIANILFENSKTGEIFSDCKLVYAGFDDIAKEKVRDFYDKQYPGRKIIDLEVDEPID